MPAPPTFFAGFPNNLERFGQNQNFSRQLSDDRLLFAACSSLILVNRGTARVKCLIQEHNPMTQVLYKVCIIWLSKSYYYSQIYIFIHLLFSSAFSFLLGLYPPRNQSLNVSYAADVFYAPYNIQQVCISDF